MVVKDESDFVEVTLLAETVSFSEQYRRRCRESSNDVTHPRGRN